MLLYSGATNNNHGGIKMNYNELKQHADKEIINTIYDDYLKKGYHQDLDKAMENFTMTSIYLTKLTGINKENNTAKFSRICISDNPAFTEENIILEQRSAINANHSITPYLISTATFEESLNDLSCFSPIEIELINQNYDISFDGSESGKSL